MPDPSLLPPCPGAPQSHVAIFTPHCTGGEVMDILKFELPVEAWYLPSRLPLNSAVML